MAPNSNFIFFIILLENQIVIHSFAKTRLTLSSIVYKPVFFRRRNLFISNIIFMLLRYYVPLEGARSWWCQE